MAAALREEKHVDIVRVNPATTPLSGDQTPTWVSASCCRGPIELDINTSAMPKDTKYRVRLHFAEIEDVEPGERVFDVAVAGETVARQFDVIAKPDTATQPSSGKCRSTPPATR